MDLRECDIEPKGWDLKTKKMGLGTLGIASVTYEGRTFCNLRELDQETWDLRVGPETKRAEPGTVK